MDLFKVGFEGILSPCLTDGGHLGYREQEDVIPKEASPLVLLGEGARLIRSLLVQKGEKGIAILPCLPKELHAGRFIQIHLNDQLTADLEWSKKLIRRMALHPKEDQEVTFTFQPAIESFRFRKGTRGHGKDIKAGETITLKGGTLYILDRFQK